ncbi:MAG: transcriptional regulator [Candidatus Woykebacteria bacterium RBG_13_40_15]|uniref:Transcriptional regulator n=1 Tax=Candidatus Woykebacteria bacterium RBG_13_40_15 TaxID=1802593 RepID=A0A1G1W7Q4_9BACT|nr:MAG: transcriptional regulator [Candidatus Woykebacteria bacterium RBG_13_40_15]
MSTETSNLLKRFGEKVKTERTKLGLSQEELGFQTGLDRTYISGIERGQRNPSLRNIGKIARALKVKLPELFDF